MREHSKDTYLGNKSTAIVSLIKRIITQLVHSKCISQGVLIAGLQAPGRASIRPCGTNISDQGYQASRYQANMLGQGYQASRYQAMRYKYIRPERDISSADVGCKESWGIR